jgi:hypothetical protein
MSNESPSKVDAVIVDVHIPFMTAVREIFFLALAAIPALLMLSLILFFFTLLFGGYAAMLAR